MGEVKKYLPFKGVLLEAKTHKFLSIFTLDLDRNVSQNWLTGLR
jgi:hypothetical protein